MSSKEISRITFTQANLIWFAEQSGDWNPIHVDPIAARRLLAGAVVVHGMYILLWALESYCVHHGKAPQKVAVRFHRPILCGEAIRLQLEEESETEHRLLAYNQEDVVATIRVEGDCPMPNRVPPEYATPLRAVPAALQFPQLKGSAGTMALQARSEAIRLQFPRLAETVGLLPLVAIMATSRVIGMFCPGLSSLYSGAEYEFTGDDSSTALDWQVVRHTIAQAPVRIKMTGGGISGYADAFVRPEPVSQPSLAQVAPRIEPGLCNGQVAWVIGGSRGLGELVSKLVGASGGHVVLTYHSGLHDAERVAAEITAHGGSSEIIHLDVHDPASISKLIESSRPPTQLYFFASSKITRPRHSIFDESLLGEFIETYVNSFARLVTTIKRIDCGPLKVFYPSTIFIDELPREFPEYAAAKSAGEALCSYLSKQIPNLEIVVRRLPRLPTDQTSGVIKIATSDPVAHLLPVVREMSIKGQ
jgi:acyl dehydratase